MVGVWFARKERDAPFNALNQLERFPANCEELLRPDQQLAMR